jgi:hypothetical protein
MLGFRALCSMLLQLSWLIAIDRIGCELDRTGSMLRARSARTIDRIDFAPPAAQCCERSNRDSGT